MGAVGIKASRRFVLSVVMQFAVARRPARDQMHMPRSNGTITM